MEYKTLVFYCLDSTDLLLIGNIDKECKVLPVENKIMMGDSIKISEMGFIT